MADATTVPLNRGRLAALRALQTADEPNVVRRVIDLFLQEMPNRMGRLADAVSRDERPTIAREAHGIRGAAGTIGAEAVFRAAGDLENAANNDAPADFMRLAAVVRHALDVARAQLLLER